MVSQTSFYADVLIRGCGFCMAMNMGACSVLDLEYMTDIVKRGYLCMLRINFIVGVCMYV